MERAYSYNPKLAWGFGYRGGLQLSIGSVGMLVQNYRVGDNVQDTYCHGIRMFTVDRQAQAMSRGNVR